MSCPQVQLLALRCLLAYREPHLSPYRAQLEALIDDEKFRDELRAF